MRWLCCFYLLSASLTLHGEALFENGRWKVPLIYPANPEPDEWYAVGTMVQWCTLVTGQRPEVLDEHTPRAMQQPAIYLGQTEAFKKLGYHWEAREGDLAICHREGQRVFIVGNSPIATRIAVGRFCERELKTFLVFPGKDGVDWEPLASVAWPQEDVFLPKFKWREVSGLGNELSQEWAYSIGYGRAPTFSHGLYAAFGKLPLAEKKKYAPTVVGKKVELQGSAYEPNPNLLASGAAEVGAKYAREWFHQHPQDFSVPLGVNDTLRYDDTAISTGWYRDRPVRTDYLINYLNQVANSYWEPSGDLQGEHHALGTLAYLQTLAAPQFRVHPAIFPWVCADRIGYGSSDFAKQELSNLAAWVKSGVRRVGAYDYWYGVDFCVPRINFEAQTRAIQQASQVGVQGWYAEVSPLWAFDAPKIWLGAKLLENPQQSSEALLHQWFQAAYGEASVAMQEVYQVCAQAWTRDAQQGGASQWLRHYRSETSVMVFNQSEIQAVSQKLSQAEKILEKSEKLNTTRHQLQQIRLRQWRDAWEMVLKMRAVYTARYTQPTNRTQARQALTQLSQAEIALSQAEQKYNLSWGAYGRPIKWAEFVSRDPRPEWFEMVRSAQGLEGFLTQWSKQDLGGLGPWLYQAHQGNGKTQSLEFSAPVELSPSRYNSTSTAGGLTHLVAPAGVLSMEGPLQVTSELLLACRVALGPVAHPESKVKLEVHGVVAAKPFYRAVNLGPQGGTLMVSVPPGVSQIIFKLNFEKEIAFKSATLTEYQLPR